MDQETILQSGDSHYHAFFSSDKKTLNMHHFTIVSFFRKHNFWILFLASELAGHPGAYNCTRNLALEASDLTDAGVPKRLYKHMQKEFSQPLDLP